MTQTLLHALLHLAASWDEYMALLCEEVRAVAREVDEGCGGEDVQLNSFLQDAGDDVFERVQCSLVFILFFADPLLPNLQ